MYITIIKEKQKAMNMRGGGEVSHGRSWREEKKREMIYCNLKTNYKKYNK